MPEQGTTPTRKKSSLLKNLASDSLFAVEPPCDAPRTLVKPTTVNAVGYAKGTQYLATGRDIPGHDTSCRHGPRTVERKPKKDGSWKGAGPLGRSDSFKDIYPPFSKVRVAVPLPTDLDVSPKFSMEQWSNDKLTGIMAAQKYAKYIESGAHRSQNRPPESWSRPGPAK